MQITTIGLDLAKRMFQIQGVDAASEIVVYRAGSRYALTGNSKRKSFLIASPIQRPVLLARRHDVSRRRFCLAPAGLFLNNTPSQLGNQDAPGNLRVTRPYIDGFKMLIAEGNTI